MADQSSGGNNFPEWQIVLFIVGGVFLAVKLWGKYGEPFVQKYVESAQGRDWAAEAGWAILAAPIVILGLSLLRQARKRSQPEKK